MVAFKNDQAVFFDCDDTLVLWNYPADTPGSDLIWINNYGTSVPVMPHKKHIEQLRAHRVRGHQIIVWSAGGWEWAQAVVTMLGLKDCVDAVMSKPAWFYDDLTSSEFMPEINRVYYPFAGMLGHNKYFQPSEDDNPDSHGQTS